MRRTIILSVIILLTATIHAAHSDGIRKLRLTRYVKKLEKADAIARLERLIKAA